MEVIFLFLRSSLCVLAGKQEFVDAIKHHMLHLLAVLQRRKTPDAERYVCLRLVYVTIILSTIVDLSYLNSKLRALWKTDNFQAMT